jgi:hypothetical protein
MSQRNLLTIAAVIECLAGLALIIAPSTMSELLLGAGLYGAGSIVGRICGFGLLALGFCCWAASSEAGGTAQSGTVAAITLYNTCVGLLLIACAATAAAHGIVVWLAGSIHLGLGLAGIALLRSSALIEKDCQTLASGASYTKHERYL